MTLNLLIFILSFGAVLLYACSDNCIAYRGSMSYSLPENMFYLKYTPREGYCTHCYYIVNASNKNRRYDFQLGLYNPSEYIFYNSINGNLYASSGFSSCETGYCAVWFSDDYTSFNIQMTEVPYINKCLYNSSFCTGYVDSKLMFENTSPKIIELDCTLS